MKQPISPSSPHVTIFLLLALLSGCGFQQGVDHRVTDLDRVRNPGRFRQTIAMPLFKNATFEPLLEKRMSQIFKETFISRGWNVTSAPGHADFMLRGHVKRFSRTPVSLNLQGQVEEYRIQIGLQFHLQQSGGKRFVTSAEERAEYIARSDAKASRIAEDRAIREAGKKMAERLADLLLTRVTPEEGLTDQ